jgi:molybdopterin-guanine dinucleotide biosynthesis protein A
MQSPNPPALTSEIAILAGGLSSRMGRDKSRLRLGKRTLLGQVRATAERLRLPVKIIRKDLVPRCGPLGGIYTALKTSHKQVILFLPCDTPFVSLALLEKLLNSLRPDDAAVFVAAHKRVSFPFLLRRDCLSVVEKQLAKRRYSLQALAAALRAKKVLLSPGEEMDLFNINTPQEWEIARQRWSAPTYRDQ